VIRGDLRARGSIAWTATVVMLTALLAGCGLISANTTPAAGGQGAPGGPASSAAARSLPFDVAPLLDPPAGKFFGIEADGAPDSLTPVTTLADNLGKKPNLIGQYVSWGNPFDASAVTRAWSYGALYYMAWEPFSTSVQSIADGQSDAYIRQFARAVRTLNLPVAISFGHEMNGNWYPWGSAQTPAATFVAAWRHIHNLFTEAGASSVIWVWNPNIINPLPQVQLKPYWPGDAYVDWVGITGYFATTGPHTYTGLYAPTVAEVKQFTSKPFIIAETSIESGPAEVTSAAHLVASVTRHSDVLGFIWFNYDKGGIDWRIESRPILRAAIAGDIAGLQLIDAKK
jgi:hypothetical protein